jgi:hypothetical protein
MDPKDVIVGECDKMWGVRFPNSHGNKYKKQCSNMEVIVVMEELWPKVYKKKIIINYEISLAFAKGIVAQWKGTKSIRQNLQQKCNFKVGKHTR